MEQNNFNPDTYWENRLHKIKGLEGVGFKKLGQSFNNWAYKVRKKVFIRELKNLEQDFKSKTILDIGSGTGFYIQAWNELGANTIIGVDISNTSVQNLKNTFKNSIFFQSDIGDKNFNAENKYKQYDLISSMDVLFHIVDDARFEQAIENISSQLKVGGYFIYSDNFLNSETTRGESQVSRSKKYLLDVFTKNKLELVTLKPFMVLTNSPIDSKNKLLKVYWFLLENALYVMPFLGTFFGALLYPLENYLVKNLKDSPTTEFAIFKKLS